MGSEDNQAQVLDGRNNPFFKKARTLYELKVPKYLRTQCKDAYTVYDMLCNYAGYTSRECFVSYDRIMDETGIASRSTVRKSLEALKEVNLITVEARYGDGGRQYTNLYTIIDELYWKIPDPSLWRVQGGTKKKSKGRNKGNKPSPPPVHEIETDSEGRKEKQDSSADEPRTPPQKKSKPRKRDHLFEAVAELMTGTPYSSEWNTKHKLDSGIVNRRVKELREEEVTPEEIVAVRVAYEPSRLDGNLSYLKSLDTILSHVSQSRNKPESNGSTITFKEMKSLPEESSDLTFDEIMKEINNGQ